MPDNKTVTFDASQYQLVPKTPTAKMAAASYQCAGFYHDPTIGENRRISIAWAAMLTAAPTPAAQSAGQEAAARYIVIGYGESDYPVAAFANDADGLLDAVLGMVYTMPTDACDDTREEYRRALADADEWCAEVWRKEFEIGGIVVYDTGERAAPVNASEAVAANFACYLIDHCEGETVTEEGVQRWLTAMLANPQYAAPVNGGERTAWRGACPHTTANTACQKCRDTHGAEYDQRAADAQQVGAWTVTHYADLGEIRDAQGKHVETVYGGQADRIAAAHNAALTSPAKVGGDEREAFIDKCICLLEASRHAARVVGIEHIEAFPYLPEYDEAVDWLKENRAALSADGGEDKRDAESIANRMIQEDDSASLFSFVTTCQDSEADGYTVDDESMKRLAELGFVRRIPGAGKRYETTAIGDWIVEAQFNQNPRLPLRTVAEHNAREQAGHALYLKESAPGSMAWVELGSDQRESWRRKSTIAANQSGKGGE